MSKKTRIFMGIFVLLLGAGVIWGVGELTSVHHQPSPLSSLEKLEKEGLPDVRLPQLDGEMLHLSEIPAPVIIVNFWASWCDPCVAEYPSMLELVEHFDGKVALVAISADEHKEDIVSFLKAFGGSQPNVYILRDPKMESAKEFGTVRLPESYIFGTDRKLAKKVVGLEDWFNPESQKYFAMLLSESKQEEPAK